MNDIIYKNICLICKYFCCWLFLGNCCLLTFHSYSWLCIHDSPDDTIHNRPFIRLGRRVISRSPGSLLAELSHQSQPAIGQRITVHVIKTGYFFKQLYYGWSITIISSLLHRVLLSYIYTPLLPDWLASCCFIAISSLLLTYVCLSASEIHISLFLWNSNNLLSIRWGGGGGSGK